MQGTYTIASKYFGSNKVCCLSCYFMQVCNEVSSNCDSYSVWVKFLWSVVHYDLGICDLSNCGFVLIALRSKKKTVFGPGVLIALRSCATFPSSMTIAFVHDSFVNR